MYNKQGVEMIKESNKNITINETLYSFDIFDTLVTRRVATPTGIFLIMQHKLQQSKNIPELIKNNFFKIRVEAECFARFSKKQTENTEEICIDDIYQLINDNYDLSRETTCFLKELEIETEIKNLVPIKKNINLLKKLVAAQKKVVLLSDMYLPEKTLRWMLVHVDTVFENIKIYVSAEYNASKNDGKIFNIVKLAENISYKNWYHYGDNKQSDIKNPQYYGINTNYCPVEHLMPYENFLINSRPEQVFFQSLCGSAKYTRMKYKETNVAYSAVFDFGASFAAPILYNFVDWVIKFSIKKGVNTIYFIARDGYIPKIIADIIIEKRKLNLKTKYLYGSRIAWRIPSEQTLNEFIDSILLEEYSDKINGAFLSYRLGIPYEILKKLLKIKSHKTILKRKERKILAEKIKFNEEIRKKVLSFQKEKKELLKAYFKQEIDFNQKDIIFVDLHGSGKTQDHVSSILNEISDCNVCSLYLTNCLGKQKEKSQKMSYFSTLNYLSFWIELLARCPKGQTIGYKKVNNKIEPVLEDINIELFNDWGFENYLTGIKSFCNDIIDFEKINGFSVNSIDLYCFYYTYFTQMLDKQTADIAGDIPYTMIGNEKNISKCAKPQTLFNALLNFLLCKKPETISEFPYISTARSGKLCKKFQKLVEKYPTIQKFCLDFHYHKRHQKAYLRIFGIKISLRHLFFNRGI